MYTSECRNTQNKRKESTINSKSYKSMLIIGKSTKGTLSHKKKQIKTLTHLFTMVVEYTNS